MFCNKRVLLPVSATCKDPLECFLSWNAWKGIVPPWCSPGNFSSLCWYSVGHCRMSQAIHLVCSEVSSCSRQNLGLLTTSQTNDPEALVRVAVFLGLSPDFYRDHGWSLHALNVGKAGRHSKQILCRPNFTSIRQQLKQIFHEEYGQLARLLDTFQLVDGSAESMVAARDWSCEEMKGRLLGLLEVGRQWEINTLW